jgi:DNA-binding NarL/FixJ family response regulator
MQAAGGEDPSTEQSHDGVNPPRAIRVLVADDYPPLLKRVVTLLSHEFTVVAAVGDGEAAVEMAARLEPDVFVLDIGMPLLDGLQAADRIIRARSTVAVVFLTVNDEPAFVQAAIRIGALGFVNKSDLGTDLVPAIRAALAGRRFISSSIPGGHLP